MSCLWLSRSQRGASLLFTLLFASVASHADPIRVQQTQGATRGFLWLRTESGETLAHGELIQTAHGSRVTSELVFHFKDGSLDDETTTFTQGETFHLVSDHHIQKGPFFPKAVDSLVEANGQVTIKTTDKDGKEKVESQHMDLPPDISNGMIAVLLLNVKKDAPEFSISMVLPAGKGRLAKLTVTPAGEQKFSDVGLQHTASVFRIKIDLGGVAGVIAPVIGKQPADVFAWVLEGSAPALVRVLQQIYEGGPVVSIELSGATFEHTPATTH